MHFSKAELPPVDAFWSVTMYDAIGYQVANKLNRFAIGDRDALRYNADGSLDIYMSHESPGKNKEPNWLRSTLMHILRPIKFIAVAVLGLFIVEKTIAEEFRFASDIDVNGDQLISFSEFKSAVGRIFRDADVNRDNIATLEELTAYAGVLDASQMENWLFTARLSLLDFNNDFDISLEEMNNNENLKALFQRMDMNLNGYLSPRELEGTAAARMLGRKNN